MKKRHEQRIVEACGDEWVPLVANAAIEEAARCYKAACKFEDLYPNEARLLKEDCLEFFNSDWYEALTDYPREKMISRLKKGDWSDFSATRKEFESMLESFGVKKRLAVIEYYRASVEPIMEKLLGDLRAGMRICVAKQVYGITDLRWNQCMECVKDFKERIEAARTEGGKALKSGERKSETEKFLSAKLPFIRSRLEAGETRTAIAKSLGISFYRLTTFLGTEKAKGDETCAPSPAEEACEDERATRAKLDAKRREDKEKLSKDLREESEGLPEGVAAQRPRDGLDGSNGDGDETGKGET